jgi:hypothetical protein
MNYPAAILKVVSDKLKSYYMESNPVEDKGIQRSESTPGPDEKSLGEKHANKAKPSSIFAAIVNGLGVGLLLGVLLGLAISPVVSGVIGTLSSLLVVLLGLNDKYMGIIKSLRIGSFGLFSVAGILLGMYIRTNDALSPRMEDLKNEYLKTGFSQNQALYFTALQYFDYVPVGWFETSEKDTLARASKSNHIRSHLFSSKVDVGQCALLKSADRDFPKSEIINSFEAAGGVWKHLALNLGPELPDQVFVDALLALRDGFCGLGQSGMIEIKSSEELKALNQNSSIETIKNTMKESGEGWNVILNYTNDQVPPDYQKQLYLNLIKLLANEKTI